MTTTTLPLAVFLSMALIAFATGSSWGVFAIAIPIVPAAILASCFSSNFEIDLGVVQYSSISSSQTEGRVARIFGATLGRNFGFPEGLTNGSLTSGTRAAGSACVSWGMRTLIPQVHRQT